MIEPVAGVDVALIMIGFVAGTLTMVARPMLVILKVASDVLAVHVTALVISSTEPLE